MWCLPKVASCLIVVCGYQGGDRELQLNIPQTLKKSLTPSIAGFRCLILTPGEQSNSRETASSCKFQGKPKLNLPNSERSSYTFMATHPNSRPSSLALNDPK